MTSLSNDNLANIIEAFNSTSRYLDDPLNIDQPYFEGMVNQRGTCVKPDFGPLQKPKYESYRTKISSRCFIS